MLRRPGRGYSDAQEIGLRVERRLRIEEQVREVCLSMQRDFDAYLDRMHKEEMAYDHPYAYVQARFKAPTDEPLKAYLDPGFEKGPLKDKVDKIKRNFEALALGNGACAVRWIDAIIYFGPIANVDVVVGQAPPGTPSETGLLTSTDRTAIGAQT